MAFCGDIIAGAFIWGDLRDLYRYIFVEKWHWTNLIIIVIAIVGILASIFLTPVGGGIVAFFKALAKGGIKSALKSMAGLEAENLGKLDPPITRGPAEIEFYDGKGLPIDVKTPPSPTPGAKWQFNIDKNVASILRQVRKKFPNGDTGASEYIHVLLDTTYMNAKDYAAFMEQLMKEASPAELARIIQVNVKL